MNIIFFTCIFMHNDVYYSKQSAMGSMGVLYIERIFVRFFAGIAGYVKKNLTKRRQ